MNSATYCHNTPTTGDTAPPDDNWSPCDGEPRYPELMECSYHSGYSEPDDDGGAGIYTRTTDLDGRRW